jgi:membrane protein
MLGPFAPAEILQLLKEQMVRIAEGRDGGLLSIGLLGAIWSSSGATVAVISAMNRAYGIQETRPWWKVRLTAVALTISLAVLIVLAFTLIIAGPQLADFVARSFGLGSMVLWTWKILQWPIAFGMVSTGFGVIYYFAPDADQDWVWITPGALAATLLWFVGSLGFRLYAVNFGHYEATYGTIGGIILLLLWFYLSGLVIVIGAEMNAEIEKASPWSRASRVTAPGEKKKIGAAAARQYRKDSPPEAPAHSQPLALPAHKTPALVERLASYLTLILLWRSRAKG